ncbi:MAG: aromatic acid/H+ symport family MFS transporter [Acidobacteriota bacterium]|nr:aromatic acid/H+ symport family MFS transporter [Acidobacteriota bacterium]
MILRIESQQTGRGPLPWGIFILCALCVMLDGFDVQAMGYVAPALIQDWRIPTPALAPVFSAALLGILFGSLFLGALADRIGRRPVLIFGMIYFSAVTIFTAAAHSLSQLFALRFLAGLGLGGMMPGAVSLAGEYSPARLRVAVMMLVSAGFTGGAALGGFISAWLIPAWGWRSVFLFGGALPMALAVLMMFLLPESPHFLSRSLRRNKARAAELFHDGRTRATLLLWLVNFTNLLNLYFLSSWVPTVAREAGYSTSTSVLLGAAVQAGGTLGAFGSAWLIARAGFVRIMSPTFALGAAAVAAIGQPLLSVPFLFAAVFIAGWSVPGMQPAVNALAGEFYPADLRSTGIGWGLGIGRIGAIVGPILGGELIAMKWSPREVFLAAAIPAAISAVAMLGLRGVAQPAATRPLSPATTPAPAEPAGRTR